MPKQGLTIYLPKTVSSQKEAFAFIKGTRQRLSKLGVKVTSVKRTDRLVAHGQYGTARVWKMFCSKRKK